MDSCRLCFKTASTYKCPTCQATAQPSSGRSPTTSTHSGSSHQSFASAATQPNQYAAASTITTPYPKDLLDETLRTLQMLFPNWDKRTQDFSARNGKPLILPAAGRRVLDLRKYHYWRERLLELYEEVYLSPPTGLKQLWRDRRDPEKYSTFIIGVMVAILTIVSTFTSVIQTATAIIGVVPNGTSNG